MIATDNYYWEYIGERLTLLPEPDFWDAWESLGQVVRALCKAKMMSMAGLEEKRESDAEAAMERRR